MKEHSRSLAVPGVSGGRFEDTNRWDEFFERGDAMGLSVASERVQSPDSFAAIDLFPWWMLHVMEPGRHETPMFDLGLILAGDTMGVAESGRRRGLRPVATYSSCVPVGSLAEIQRRLLNAVQLHSSTGRDCSEDVASAALVGLAHLRQRNEPGICGDAWSRAVEAVTDHAGAVSSLSSLGLLVARNSWSEFAEPLARTVKSGEYVVGLEIPGVLACLGAEGMKVASRLLDWAPRSNATPVRAALDAWMEQDFDGLDPHLNSGNWRERCATVRLMGHLARTGRAPVAILEMLLARCREEGDSDTLSVLGGALGETIRQLGPDGARMAIEVIRETAGGGATPALLDGIAVAGPGLVSASDLEQLRPLVKPHGLAGVMALNRCLAWHEGVPISLCDWIQDGFYKVLQWQEVELPPAVSGWFSKTPTIPGHQICAAIIRGVAQEIDGVLAAQYLREHPEITPVLESLCIKSLHAGDEPSWEILSAVLAGSRHRVTLHPAELRCALGIRAGAPLKTTWAAVGRLIAIAGSPLDHASDAIHLISQMGAEAREVALHALDTKSAADRSETGAGAVPAPIGLRVNRRDHAMLGRSRLRLEDPAGFPEEFQMLFGLLPSKSKETVGLLGSVERAAVCQLNLADKILPSRSASGPALGLGIENVEALRRAIIASAMSHSRRVNDVGLGLAAAAAQSGLPMGEETAGVLAAIHIERARLVRAGQSGESPLAEIDGGPEAIEEQLEEILSELNDEKQ